MSALRFLAPRHVYDGDRGWSRRVDIGGVEYVVAVERGRPVRIPYKPRGQNRGWEWFGIVRALDGRMVWSGKVGGSLGARGLCRAAGLLEGLAS